MIPDNFNDLGIQLPILIAGWSALGCLVGAVVFGFLVALLDEDLGFVTAFLLGAGGVIAGVIWLIMLVPFEGRYWHDYRVDGHVESVSNVLMEASGELTRQPVLTLDSVDRPLVVDDPRAVELQGADVSLRCSIGWQWRAADTYSCRVISWGGAQ